MSKKETSKQRSDSLLKMNITSPNFRNEETPLHMEKPMEYPTWEISIISIAVYIIEK